MAGELSTQYVITAEMQAGNVVQTLEGIGSALNKIANALGRIKSNIDIKVDPKIETEVKELGKKVEEIINKMTGEVEKSKGRGGRKRKVKPTVTVEPDVEISPKLQSSLKTGIDKFTEQFYKNMSTKELEKAFSAAKARLRNFARRLNEEMMLSVGEELTEGAKKRLERLSFQKQFAELEVKYIEKILEQKKKQEQLLKEKAEAEKKAAKVQKEQEKATIDKAAKDADEFQQRLEELRKRLAQIRSGLSKQIRSMRPSDIRENLKYFTTLSNIINEAEIALQKAEETGQKKYLTRVQTLFDRLAIVGSRKSPQLFMREYLSSLGMTAEQIDAYLAEEERKLMAMRATQLSQFAIQRRAIGGAAEAHSIIHRDLALGFDPENWQEYYTFQKQLERIRAQLIQTIMRQQIFGISSYGVIPLFDEMGNKVGQFAVLVDRSGKVLINFERGLKELFSTMFYRMGVWAVATAGVYMFINGVKNAIGYIIEISRQIALLKLAAEGLDFSRLYEGFGSIIAEYGGDLKEVANITYEFTKVLRDEEDVLNATRLALIAYNISGLEYKEAATLLIGVMKQYGLNIKQLEELIDAWAIASRRGTVDFKEMAQAFNQTAASAKALGIGFKELTALIELSGTATGETGSVVGTFLKFILEHARDIDVLRTLQEDLGIAVFDANGNFRSTSDILVDLAEKWKDMTDAQKTYLSITWASYRQGTRFKALLDLMAEGKYAELLKEINRSQGEAAYQNFMVMNTLEGQWRKLTSYYTVFVTRLGDTGPALALKEILNIINSLLGAIQNLNFAGLKLSDIFLGVLGAIGLNFYILSRRARGAIETMVSDITSGLKSMQSNIAKIAESLKIQAVVPRKEITHRLLEAFLAQKVSEEEVEKFMPKLQELIDTQFKKEAPKRVSFFEQLKKSFSEYMTFMSSYADRGRKPVPIVKETIAGFAALRDAITAVGSHYMNLARTTLTWANISKVAISGVKGAIVGLATTLKEAFKWFIIVEGALKIMEFVLRKINEGRERKAEMARAKETLPYMKPEDLQERIRQWTEVQSIPPLSESELQRYSELKARFLQGEELTAKELVEFEEYKKREEAERKRREIRPYIDLVEEAKRAIATSEAYNMLADEYGARIEKNAVSWQDIEKYMQETWGFATKVSEAVKKPGMIIPLPDINTVKQHEQELNRLLDINNREINRRVELINRLKDSYLELGFSTEYYNNLIQQMQSSYGDILNRYNVLLEQFNNIHANYLKAKQDFEAVRSALASKGVLEAVEKAYYSGEMSNKVEATDLEQYRTALEAYERYYSMYTKIEDSLKDVEGKLFDIQKQTLEAILSTEKYYGVWDNIKERIDLVKKSLAEIRYFPYQLQAISNVAQLGTQLFGRGWNRVDYVLNALDQQLDSIFSQLAQMEFYRLTAGEDLTALQQALEEMAPLDQKLQTKVTEPLVRSADSLQNVIRQQIEAINQNTQAVNNLTSNWQRGTLGMGDLKKLEGAYASKVSTPADLVDKATFMAKYVGIDPRLLYATIDIESSWKNVFGDSGRSVGYGQINIDALFGDINSKWWGYLEEAVQRFYSAAPASYADLKREDYRPDILEKIRSRQLGSEELKELLLNPDINLFLSALHLKEDLEAAGGDVIKARRYYKGDYGDIEKWMATLEKYGLTSAFSNVVSEVKKSNQELSKVYEARKRDLLTTEQEITQAIRSYPVLVEEQISLFERIKDLVGTIDTGRIDVINEALKRSIDMISKVPAIFDQVADKLVELSNKLVEAAKADVDERLQQEIGLRTIFGNIIPEGVRKVSEIYQSAQQEILQVASKLPPQLAANFIPYLRELESKRIEAVLNETVGDLSRQLNVGFMLKSLVPSLNIDYAGIAEQALNKAIDFVTNNPAAFNAFKPIIQALSDFLKELKYNPSYQARDLSQAISSIVSGSIGSTDFYQALDRASDILNNMYSLPKLIEQLSNIFEQLPTEVPNIYKKLSEAKILQANRDLTVLYEQLRQVYEVFNSLTPLSVEYYTVLNDLVNLHEKERQLLEQRVEDTRKLFELTGKGLNEFIKTKAQYDNYIIGLLQNIRAQAYNKALQTTPSDTAEYYALLGEVVELEKRWQEILRERTDLLSEAFKIGVINLRQYVEGLEKLRNTTYELRSLGLKTYEGTFEGIKNAFSRSLVEALRGTSENPYADFVTSIKESMANLVSETFTEVLFNVTNIRSMLEENIIGIVNAIFTGKGNVDVGTLRDNLNKIISALSAYFPAFKQALEGIFETLKDQVYNAPSGFKIESYVYEFMKARGPSDIPGLQIPGEPSQVPELPQMPSLEQGAPVTVPSAPSNPLQETINKMSTGFDAIVAKLGEHSSKFDTIIQLLKGFFEKFGIKTQSLTERVVATIPKGLYYLENGRAYIWSRLLGAMLGKEVEWDEKTGQVIIGGRRFIPHKVEGGRSYVGVREVAEALGYEVDWNDETQQITIKMANTTDKIKENTGASVGLLGSILSVNNEQLGQEISINSGVLAFNGISTAQLTVQQGILEGVLALPNAFLEAVKNLPAPIVNVTVYGGGSTTSGGGTWGDYISLGSSDYGISVAEAGGWDAWEDMIANDLSSYHRGGIVPMEQIALLRRDEMVLPPYVSSRFISYLENTERILSSNFGNSNTFNNVVYNVNLTVNGSVSQNDVDLIQKAVQEAIEKVEKERARDIRVTSLRKYGVSYMR